jgi:hypothetical protein
LSFVTFVRGTSIIEAYVEKAKKCSAWENAYHQVTENIQTPTGRSDIPDDDPGYIPYLFLTIRELTNILLSIGEKPQLFKKTEVSTFTTRAIHPSELQGSRFGGPLQFGRRSLQDSQQAPETPARGVRIQSFKQHDSTSRNYNMIGSGGSFFNKMR